MKFIDLKAQYLQHKIKIDAAISGVLSHGQFLFGPEVSELEKALADYVGSKNCIVMSSGTTALHVALMALDIQPDDEIITVPFSFFATAEVAYLMRAKLHYVEIDRNTYLMNPDLLEAAITKKTKAIITVSLYGQCCNMDVINAIAKRYNVPVIEDAAQSFGATYKNRKSCNISEIACTSFFPSKPLGAYGDGGACFTNDTALAKKMRLIINHGQDVRYHHVALGMNGRMDTLQAAILLEKLKFFDHEVKQRQQVANWYHDGLTAINIQPPIILDYNNSVYAQYTIQVDHRDLVQKKLSELDIPTAVHYPIGLHQQPYVRTQHKQDVQSFPVTELCAKRVLSLPFYPSMSREDVEIVCERLKSVMN